MEDQISSPGIHRRWLALSAALNLVLVVTVVVSFATSRFSHVRGLPAGGTAAGSASFQHDPRATEQALRSVGFTSEQAKRAVYLLVAESARETAPYEYWKPMVAREARERLARYRRDETVRDFLIQVYGNEAATDPAFAAAFHPYERELPMLDSDQQLRLEALRMQELKSNGGGMPARPPQRDTIEAAFAEDLRGEVLFEYQLRESPLARALSVSPFDFTETEFRESFRVLAAAHPERVMAPVGSLTVTLRDNATAGALQPVLGAERYAQFQRLLDPRYMMLRRIGAMRGVGADKIDQAYALMNASGTSAAEQKLSSLLGAEATADVLRAYDPMQRPLATTSTSPPAEPWQAAHTGRARTP